MSLINDALKRVSKSQPAQAARPADGPPLTPAQHQRPAQWPIVAVPLLLLGVLIVAVWFFHQALNASRQAILAKPDDRVIGRETAPQNGVAPTPVPGNQTVAAGVPAVTSNLAVAVQPPAEATNSAGPLAPEEAGSTPSAEPAPTSPPPLKLKGIFYRPAHPTAMINSKTVSIGDSVDGAQVIAITREGVSLLRDGQTNVLTLAQ